MRNGNGKLEVSKSRRIVGWVIWGILYPILVFAILSPEKKADSLVAAPAALKPATAAPQYVCRNENNKTCCATKVAIGSTATFDVTVNLPPGSHTLGIRISADGAEYCYAPDTVGVTPEAPPPVYTGDRLTNPVRDHMVVSPFGIKHNDHEHAGVDFYADPNEDVVAAMDGIVSSKFVRGGLILTIFGNGPSGIKAVSYSHLQSILVAQGSKVIAGDKIATTLTLAKNRRGTGHLHFQVMDAEGKTIDPCSVMGCE